MDLYVYDENGELILDQVRRETYLLAEENDRITALLDKVRNEMGVDVQGPGSLRFVVALLEKIRKEPPDRASDAIRFLNQFAAIDWSVKWHAWFIRKKKLPIELSDYFTN